MSSRASPRQSSEVDVGVLAAVVLAAAAFFVAARLCMVLPRHDGRLAPIWIPNAIALTALLRTDRKLWPAIVGGSLAGNLLASMAAGSNLVASLCMMVANGLEYVIGAMLLRRLLGSDVRIGRGRDLGLLALVGFGVALLAAAVASVSLYLLQGDPPLASLRTWMFAHPLSFLLVTPCLLALSRPREHLLDETPSYKAVGAMLALVVSAALVFSQNRFPILFLIPPMLLLVSLQLGMMGAALGVLITGLISVAATVTSHGPLSLVEGDTVERTAILQLFLVVSLFSSLPVASLQTRQRRLQASTLAEAERAARAEAAAALSESRFKLLADKASDAIVTLNLKGEFTYLSPAIRMLTGYSDMEMLGRTPQEFIDPADYPDVLRAFEGLARGTRAAGIPIEYRFRRKDGRWIWLQVNPQVVLDDAGQATAFVDVARDVTSQKEMEAQLRAARAEAESASAVKSEFLDNMSHELRTPLTSIIGFAGLLRHSDGLNPQHQLFAERILKSSNVLLSTINDVLDYSKLESDKVTLESQQVGFRNLVMDALEIVQSQADQKGLILEARFSEALPHRVVGDEMRLRQILLNLLGNAVKFTALGGVRVDVDSRTKGADVIICCRVSDTGIGIAPEVIPQLFNRFVQADGSTTRKFGGTGLGLSICDRIVGLMGGRIGVESRPGEGSTFWFEVDLPIAQAQGVAA